jgi:hypothetical protein
MSVIKGSGVVATIAGVIGSEIKYIDYVQSEMANALMLPAAAVDYQPGTFGPISITRTIPAADVTKLYDMLERELLGIHRGMCRPDSEWFDEQ